MIKIFSLLSMLVVLSACKTSQSSSSNKAYVDILDGQVYRSHEILYVTSDSLRLIRELLLDSTAGVSVKHFDEFGVNGVFYNERSLRPKNEGVNADVFNFFEVYEKLAEEISSKLRIQLKEAIDYAKRTTSPSGLDIAYENQAIYRSKVLPLLSEFRETFSKLSEPSELGKAREVLFNLAKVKSTLFEKRKWTEEKTELDRAVFGLFFVYYWSKNPGLNNFKFDRQR